MNIRIAILEDNTIQIEELIKFLKDFENHHNVIFNVHSYNTSKLFYNDYLNINPQIIFFDVQLSLDENVPNGIEVAKEIRKNGYTGDIIFLTNFKEYVFDGYDVNAYNFLLKPINTDKLSNVLISLCEKYEDRVYLLTNSNSVIEIPLFEIITITSSGHNLLIATQKQIYVERKKLSDIENELPSYFVRCHRTCIANINHIVKINNSEIMLSNKTRQSISKPYLQNVQHQYMLRHIKQ